MSSWQHVCWPEKIIFYRQLLCFNFWMPKKSLSLLFLFIPTDHVIEVVNLWSKMVLSHDIFNPTNVVLTQCASCASYVLQLCQPCVDPVCHLVCHPVCHLVCWLCQSCAILNHSPTLRPRSHVVFYAKAAISYFVNDLYIIITYTCMII